MKNEQPFTYAGKELQLFSKAVKWKKYFAEKIIPYISGNVLEAGAGTGDTRKYLMNNKVIRWTSIEPDKMLYKKLEASNNERSVALNTNIFTLPDTQLFDVIIYIDVLEHIEDDREEIRKALKHLKKEGRLIILSPAYNSLMNEFDKEIGHYRRYTKTTLRKAVESDQLKEVKLFHLESAGVSLLILNKYLFKKKYPDKRTIKIWDTYFIPVSRIIDRLLNYSTGKTIIGIWQKL